MPKYVDADAERKYINSAANRGKVDANALKTWLTNNEKSGTLKADPAPVPPPVFIEPYPSRKLGVEGIPDVVKVIQTTFTDPADVLAALAIGVAESSLETAARNPHPEYGAREADRGLWQISSHWWPQYTDETCDTPTLAIVAVKDIKAASSAGWKAWDTFKSGVAQSHYDAAVSGWPALRPYVPGA